MSNEHELDNARRTLERYFAHQAAMNTQSHMSERVMHPPIHSAVAGVLQGIAMFNECYPSPA